MFILIDKSILTEIGFHVSSISLTHTLELLSSRGIRGNLSAETSS